MTNFTLTQFTLRIAYASGSLANLQSHIRTYFIFCPASEHPRFKTSIAHICNFLVSLGWTLSFGTIRNYLSSLQVFHKLHNIPVNLCKDFHIMLTLHGLKRRLREQQPAAKLPITLQILLQLYMMTNFSSLHECIFWTASLLALFTFFRKSNLFSSSMATFNPLCNLTRENITIFPSFTLVTVNWTKTLQYQERTLTVPTLRIPGSP